MLKDRWNDFKKSDNTDFIKDLYKNILKVEVDESNEGFKNWMKVLS